MVLYPQFCMAAVVMVTIAVQSRGTLATGGAGTPTCFDILATSILPPVFDGVAVVANSAQMRRQSDGRIFAILLAPLPQLFFVPGQPLDTAGVVCCHTGASPELSAGDADMSPVFQAAYVVGVNCTRPSGEALVFSPSMILDPEVLAQAVVAHASSALPAVPDLVCGSTNELDCDTEFGNAERSEDFLGVCSRCVTESGGFPLRSRCQRCCQECLQVTCFALPAEIPAPFTPNGLPLPVPVPMSNFSEPVTLNSVLVTAPDRRLLVYSPTDAPEPLRASACCYEGGLPQLVGAPGGTDASQSFGASFDVLRVGCSGSNVVYTDPAVVAMVVQ